MLFVFTKEMIELFWKSTEMLRFYGFLIWANKCGRYAGFSEKYVPPSHAHTHSHSHSHTQWIAASWNKWLSTIHKIKSYRQKGIMKITNSFYRLLWAHDEMPISPWLFSVPLNRIFLLLLLFKKCSRKTSKYERHRYIAHTHTHTLNHRRSEKQFIDGNFGCYTLLAIHLTFMPAIFTSLAVFILSISWFSSEKNFIHAIPSFFDRLSKRCLQFNVHYLAKLLKT